MKNTARAMLALWLGAWSAAPAAPPEAQITNETLRVRVWLPEAQTGFYRGTRFDWSGMIGGLEFAGHDFFPQWFQRSDPKVHDFTYDGANIVASLCTAATGPAEEFSTRGKALGFDEAKPGGTFLKIGVGVLRRPDAAPYDPYRLYPIQDAGRWVVKPAASAMEFTHTVADPATGYAYEYRKTVALAAGQARMTLGHRLRNTGRRVIQTSVYNHNFLHLDRLAPGPDFQLLLPFGVQTAQPLGLAELQGNRIGFTKVLSGEDRVYLELRGFGTEARDHDLRVENRRLGVGMRITGDRPLSRLALWAIRAPLSIEPFIDMEIKPGKEFTWETRYDFYKLQSPPQ